MPDLHTTFSLLGIDVPVTVTWHVESDDGDIGIEAMMSDTHGDLTDLLCNGTIGCELRQMRVADPRQRDPIQATMFGRPVRYEPNVHDTRIKPWAQPMGPIRQSLPGAQYRYLQQHEGTKPHLYWVGGQLQRIEDEIQNSPDWDQANWDYADSRDNDRDWGY